MIITLYNYDLLIVGIAVAGIGLLGFIVYFNNINSETNKSFFLFCLITMFWGISNYLEYKFTQVNITLWVLRFHLFLSVWHAFYFFKFSYVFPKDDVKFPSWYKKFIVPLTIFTSILTLSPFVFKGIYSLAGPGEVTDPEKGPGIIIFVAVAFSFLIFSILNLISKIKKSRGVERYQLDAILAGMIIMAGLILSFNVFLPVFVHDLSFIPYAAAFIFPFIAFTSYTVYKHKLFNIKITAIALVAFILSIFSLFNVIYATTLGQTVINIIFFVSIFSGSIILIKSIIKEVKQREHIEKLAVDLKKANDRLRELDKQKSEFVSFATHQLRAPLTAMKGYASLLLDGDMGTIPDSAKIGVSRIFESTNTLVSIVNDYLNVSRIELGTMKYDFSEIDLKALIEEVIAELKPNIEKTKLQFSFTSLAGRSDFRIHADKDKLKQVFANLIDNSLKYTPQGSVQVSLDYDTEKQKFVFCVKDTGVGIAKEVIPKLFQKFSRADNASKVNIRGTGLGLFVAKQMIEIHHGNIRAESEGEGKGSTFIVELEPLMK